MAALLVAMSIMAIMMTVVMPVWKQASTREKEEELIFRGMQYARAIGLFQRKFANAYPPNVEVLVDQKFLRKKFKDPITNDDFAPLAAGQAPGAQGQPGAGGQRGGAQPSGRGQTTPGTMGQQPAQTQPGSTLRGVSPIGTPGAGGGTTAGISGVTSKSKAQSIRLYNGRNHYNEWAFVFVPQVQAPGAGAPGATAPGVIPGRGGTGTNPRGGPSNPRGGPFDNPGVGTGRGGRGFGPGSGGPGQVPIMPPGRGRI